MLFKKVYKLCFGLNGSNIANITLKRPAFLWTVFSLEVMLGKARLVSPPCLISFPLSFPQMPSTYRHSFTHFCPIIGSSDYLQTFQNSLIVPDLDPWAALTNLESLVCLGCLGTPYLELSFSPSCFSMCTGSASVALSAFSPSLPNSDGPPPRIRQFLPGHPVKQVINILKLRTR